MKPPYCFIARARKSDKKKQALTDHLFNVSALAEKFAGKANLPQSGKLVGLLHDLGKHSQDFQRYIRSATGLITPDSDEYVDHRRLKGKIDHSTGGAQHLWRKLACSKDAKPYGQLLALSVASHHSGLIDCLAPDGTQVFCKRMEKEDQKTHLEECLQACEPAITEALEQLLTPTVLKELHSCIKSISIRVRDSSPQNTSEGIGIRQAVKQGDFPPDSLQSGIGIRQAVEQGLLARFLLSCLLDADRIDSAEFEDPAYKDLRSAVPRKPWDRLIQRLEEHLKGFEQKYPIDLFRSEISNACHCKADEEKGLFTLTVPTGGGKTLASLRFALHHAQKRDMERIIYIIPYTSIIEQNAKAVREILEKDEDLGRIILEHHSNLLPDESAQDKDESAGKETQDKDESADEKNRQNKRQNKLLIENWEAPIIFTTMVQFLESLFGSGTRHTRRMHNLANSVIIFDEIQTLPLSCTYLFCNALNFLLGVCGVSAVLCTATQPCLDELPNPHLGKLPLSPTREMMPNVPTLFTSLQRVKFFDHCDKEFTAQEIADLALEELKNFGSCLVVCNTKKLAEEIYSLCHIHISNQCYYLSTQLCPAHRLEKLEALRKSLDAKNEYACVVR